MKLEMYFEESIYRKQMELLYNCGYGEKQKYYKNSHYLGFGLFAIGILFIIDKRDFGYTLIIFALGILIPYFVFFYKNKKVSKKLVEGQNEIVSIYTQNPKIVLEFSETEFTYSDYESERIIAWKDFLTFIIIEENIFIFTKDYEPFVIGKPEAGEENYEQILQIIEKKVKK